MIGIKFLCIKVLIVQLVFYINIAVTRFSFNDAIKTKTMLLSYLNNQNIDLSSAKIIFYYGPDYLNHEVFNLENIDDILKHENFDQNKKTTFYVHGFAEKQTDESILVIVNAYNKRNDENLLVLDWEELAKGNYLREVLPKTKILGKKVALVLLELFVKGLYLHSFHLVGHSLGGQVAGIIGRTIIEESNGNFKLPRISALDPAFPGFYIVNFIKAINANDADFVDVIHTDGGVYGAPFNTGTVDFWPNGGKFRQPGCPTRNAKFLSDIDLCSHRRSWHFWAESVANEYTENFLAIQADNWFEFKLKNYRNYKQTATMGYFCSTDISGSYYLRTNAKPPYAKGLAGI